MNSRHDFFRFTDQNHSYRLTSDHSQPLICDQQVVPFTPYVGSLFRDGSFALQRRAPQAGRLCYFELGVLPRDSQPIAGKEHYRLRQKIYRFPHDRFLGAAELWRQMRE